MVIKPQISLEAVQEIHGILDLSTPLPQGGDNISGSLDHIMIQLAERLTDLEATLREHGIEI